MENNLEDSSIDECKGKRGSTYKAQHYSSCL